MSEVKAIVGRFPMHELALRRLYRRNPDFRVICDDYALAQRALRHWKAIDGRAAEYRQIVEELEVEIAAAFEANTAQTLAATGGKPPDESNG